MVGAHEEVVERELVAGGAAQADGVPDVGPLDVLGAHQHGALQRRAVGVVFGRPVGGVDRTMRAEPGRVPAAGCKRPHAGDPVAALAFDRADLGTGPPRQHRARIAEDRLRHRQVEIGRRHRATAGLAEAPGGGGIGFGDGFDDVEKRYGIGFDPVGRARQQQPEQLRLVQSVEQRGRQPARGLDLARKLPRRRDARPRPGRSPPGRRQDRQNVAIGVFKICACRTLAVDRSSPSASSLSICSIDLPLVSKPMK